MKCLLEISMREPQHVKRKQLMFQDEFDYRLNYRELIEWKPGRTPSALEIIELGLLHCKKVYFFSRLKYIITPLNHYFRNLAEHFQFSFL